jgi:lipoyl(octanoyl) transferase
MEEILAEMLAGGTERVIFCEMEPVLTVGSSGDRADIGADPGVPVVETGRGGKVTYHGPGQRVVYLVVDLARWGKDVRAYVKWLQAWLIASLGELGVVAEAGAQDEIGVWIGDRKVAAIGVRVRKGVAYHGVALNVSNDMAVYGQFVPCGITDKGVTRLADVGIGDMVAVDGVLEAVLGRMMPGVQV